MAFTQDERHLRKNGNAELPIPPRGFEVRHEVAQEALAEAAVDEAVVVGQVDRGDHTRCQRPVLDDRTPEEILGYDRDGGVG